MKEFNIKIVIDFKDTVNEYFSQFKSPADFQHNVINITQKAKSFSEAMMAATNHVLIGDIEPVSIQIWQK